MSGQKISNVLYLLFQRNYFSGPGGRTSHAAGFVAGLLANRLSVHLLSGPNSASFIRQHQGLKRTEITGRLFWTIRCLFVLQRAIFRAEIIVVRWKLSSFLILVPILLLRRTAVWVEVNSITGYDSSFLPLRLLSKISITITLALFKVIVVSEIQKIFLLDVFNASPEKICIIVNGFNPSIANGFRLRFEEGVPLTLVYFGRKELYYDWDMLFSVVEKLEGDGIVERLENFGFLGEKTPLSILSHGPYEPSDLAGKLSSITNPVLVLHGSDSSIMKAGSPTKLFEYLAFGIPVIVSSTINLPSCLLHRGVVYKAGSADSLREAIISIAKNSEVLFARKFDADELLQYTWPYVVRPWITLNFEKTGSTKVGREVNSPRTVPWSSSSR